jgi:hypothetical protein
VADPEQQQQEQQQQQQQEEKKPPEEPRSRRVERPTDEQLAQLDPQVREWIELANAEAAARRHDVVRANEKLSGREQELEELRKAHESEQERVVREAEERGKQAAAGEYAPRLLEADLAIAAAGRLRDPQDAVGLISSEARQELLELRDREARRKRADAVIEELLEAKPYLAAERSDDRGKGLVTQGARSSGWPSRSATNPDEWLRERSKKR